MRKYKKQYKNNDNITEYLNKRDQDVFKKLNDNKDSNG